VATIIECREIEDYVPRGGKFILKDSDGKWHNLYLHRSGAAHLYTGRTEAEAGHVTQVRTLSDCYGRNLDQAIIDFGFSPRTKIEYNSCMYKGDIVIE
jgi:hypothetical protein